MDAHDLAVAALQEVAQSAANHPDMNPSADRDQVTRYGAPVTSRQMDVVAAAVVLKVSSSFSTTKEMRIQQDISTNGRSGGPPAHQGSSANSQSTFAGVDGLHHEIESTSSTSTSEGVSSQSTNQDSQLSQLSQLSKLAAAQPSMNETRPNPATAGQKRTADGQVKAGSPTRPQSYSHSRNTSTVSTVPSTASSRIGEVRY